MDGRKGNGWEEMTGEDYSNGRVWKNKNSWYDMKNEKIKKAWEHSALLKSIKSEKLSEVD